MILPNISILARASDKIDLLLLDALLTKEYKPIINIQTDDFNRTLTIGIGEAFIINFFST